MTIANHLRAYLSREHIPFDEVPHTPTQCASMTAQAAHVSGARIAKAVLLRTDGNFMLAVLPATHHVRLDDLRHWLGREVGLATEDDITSLFGDCDRGAIPPLGDAYGIETVLDDSLLVANGDIFFEASDHRTLVRLNDDSWRRVTRKMPHRVFSA